MCPPTVQQMFEVGWTVESRTNVGVEETLKSAIVVEVQHAMKSATIIRGCHQC